MYFCLLQHSRIFLSLFFQYSLNSTKHLILFCVISLLEGFKHHLPLFVRSSFFIFWRKDESGRNSPRIAIVLVPFSLTYYTRHHIFAAILLRMNKDFLSQQCLNISTSRCMFVLSTLDVYMNSSTIDLTLKIPYFLDLWKTSTRNQDGLAGMDKMLSVFYFSG